LCLDYTTEENTDLLYRVGMGTPKTKAMIEAKTHKIHVISGAFCRILIFITPLTLIGMLTKLMEANNYMNNDEKFTIDEQLKKYIASVKWKIAKNGNNRYIVADWIPEVKPKTTKLLYDPLR
jgi:hypothetical protein